MVNGSFVPIQGGDLLLFKPGDPYELRIEEHDTPRNGAVVASGDYYVMCRGTWLDEWWNRVPSRPPLTRINMSESLLGTWRQLILERRRIGEENPEITDYLLRTLCLQLERAVSETNAYRGKSFTGARMKSYVEEHANMPFKVEDVANHVGLSVSRAVHLFKQIFGKTMIQYALEIRLSTAIERMKYSTMTLEQIAESCGFGSYSYFHRVFREKYGVSPTDYRSSETVEPGARSD